MEYRVEIYSVEKGNFQVEVVYEGQDINEGIHQETLAREHFGNSFSTLSGLAKIRTAK